MNSQALNITDANLIVFYSDAVIDVEAISEEISKYTGRDEVVIVWLPTDARIEVYTDPSVVEIGLKRIGDHVS